MRLSGTDGKRFHYPYRYADPRNGSLLFVATFRDLGSLPQGQATQNPVATEASISWNCSTFRGVERLASVFRTTTWWRLNNVVSYAIVASRQSKSLSRGLCPYHPNRVAHYRYTLKMRLPYTCTLSPLRRVARATPLMVGAVIASMAASSRQVRWAHFFLLPCTPSVLPSITP